MRRLITIGLMVVVLTGLNGCKDFLNVQPLTNMSGNNFWKTQQDVEQFTRGLYDRLRSKVIVNSYFIVIGELRCSPWIENKKDRDRKYIGHLANNQIRQVVTVDADGWDPYFDFSGIADWTAFYKVIQGAN